ncbi:4-(cytidine 5'-diphospho)-2-C-methyl-D-erythritol kinase [uncultured Sphingomonas sp.]|uniref:4-(cytidine 5'-diphospho)-2-C-methyl-D-erythritol kinase n=1 Tax=uncultured Sphingomonas sp. TaxID=158754 RepID=UPI0025E124F8|nr:4-(cytidine 5'-diphospho)-2-C-methyl-D-erythritol kinase [uncultured Sphingomonas sp.]
MAEIAFAKLNLALHVRRREDDGYHAIETLFAFCEDGDHLTLEEVPGLRVVGRFADALGDPADNLVLRAARAFRAAFGGAEWGFTLDKKLPVAAGIGGGSADAAAALRLLARVAGVAPDDARVMEIATGLGADVPACLLSRPVRGEARGDTLQPLEGVPAGAAVLLVNPLVPLSTAAVFRAWDGVDRGPLGDGDAIQAALSGRNDLEAPALRLCPDVGAVLARLAALAGVRLTRMSGSGATCFTLLEDDAARDDAAAAVTDAYPGWWILPTRLR